MMKSLKYSALILAGGLSACAVAPPAGPSIAAMPGAGKDFNQFQTDDAVCRQYASSLMPVNATQTSQQNAVGTAVGGAALGAAAGALIGAGAGNPGAGAAIGGGVGLLAGSSVAANNAGVSSNDLQYRYDVGYAQCMSGRGDRVPDVASAPPGGLPGPYYGNPYYYGYPYWDYPFYGYPGFIYFGGGWHRR